MRAALKAERIKLRRSLVWPMLLAGTLPLLILTAINHHFQPIPLVSLSQGVEGIVKNWLFFMYPISIGVVGSLYWQEETRSGMWGRLNSTPMAPLVLHVSRFVVLAGLNALMLLLVVLESLLFLLWANAGVPVGDWLKVLKMLGLIGLGMALPLVVVHMLSLLVRNLVLSGVIYVSCAVLSLLTQSSSYGYLHPFNLPFQVVSAPPQVLLVSLLVAAAMLRLFPNLLPKK